METHRPGAVATQQGLHLGNEAGPEIIRQDPNLTVQILENLISNAVRCSPPGRDIHVRLKQSVESVRCEVKDEGPGLSTADQKKLFGKFARLSAMPKGGEHSTGLGLSVVTKMVEAIHGRVWCENELGHGATFLVEFPIS